MSRNNSSKGSKNSEYSIHPGLYQDVDRVIFNFSSYELTDEEKNVLCKGLNFSVKPGWIEYSECLLPFELLFRDIKRKDLCNKDMSFLEKLIIFIALEFFVNLNGLVCDILKIICVFS